MDKHYDVLIVGAGHAGAQAAASLRQEKFTGTIAMLGDELELPYERPPLSKEYLAREKEFDRIMIHPAKFWEDRAITMLMGNRVTALDAAAHQVTVANGATIGYGSLIWATGGTPRKLVCSGHDLVGIHTVRNRADVDRIMAELPLTSRIVVIGGGYIGLEAAAVLTKLGKPVTVVEALDRVLARVAGAPLSRFYEAEHRAHGVDIRLESKVDCIEEQDGHVAGVRLADGEILQAEMVIVGIGIIPSVEPLLEAGAKGGNGVEIDANCRTSLPDIYAIGDCAAHVNDFGAGARLRLESVQNAVDQAIVAAKAIVGAPVPYHAVPWFWSNQYDLKLQTVGLSIGYDDTVVRGDIAARAFSVIYLKAGRVIALDCVNTARDYIQGRALVVAGASPDPAALADIGIALKSLVAA